MIGVCSAAILEHRVDYMTIKYRVLTYMIRTRGLYYTDKRVVKKAAEKRATYTSKCNGSHMKSSQVTGVTEVEPVCEKQEE